MANRVIYNVLALYAGPSPSTGYNFLYSTGLSGVIGTAAASGVNRFGGQGPNVSGISIPVNGLPIPTANYSKLTGITNFSAFANMEKAAPTGFGNLATASGAFLSGVTNRISQLARVQSFDESFTRNLTDVNQFGNLAAIDRIEIETPDITANFSYYLSNGRNEELLGLTVANTTAPSATSCISGFLTKTTDDRNMYLLVVEEGYDAAGYNRSTSGVIGIGNCFLSSYTANFAVGEIPSADIEMQGLNIRVLSNMSGESPSPAVSPIDGSSISNIDFVLPIASSITGNQSVATLGNPSLGLREIPKALQPGDIQFTLPSTSYTLLGLSPSDVKVQDATLSIDLARTPLQKLGTRYAFSREIDFPVTATLEINANIGDLASGTYQDLLCGEAEKEFTLSIYDPACIGSARSTAMSYTFKGAKLTSQSLSASIGDNVSVAATYEVQIGSSNDTSKGIFISGSHR